MKKIFALFGALCLGIGIYCIDSKQALPIPDYPLEPEIILQALEDWGYSCTAEESLPMLEGQTAYNFYPLESKHSFVGVRSLEKNGERALSITLPRFHSPNPIAEDAYQDALAFASILFGGFRDKDQVYHKFIREYDSINTEITKSELLPEPLENPSPTWGYTWYDKEAVWESTIRGITCRIYLVQPKLDEPQEFLTDIVFATDYDTFFVRPEES